MYLQKIKEEFCVLKNIMDDELLYFTKNVLIEEKDEVAIAIELKNMLIENGKIIVLLQIDGKTIAKFTIRRRNYDNKGWIKTN